MCPDTSDLTARALWAFHASEAYEGLGQAKKSLEALKYYCSLRDSLEDNIHSADVLHIRELWQYEHLKARNTALEGRNSSANASHTGRCWPAARYCCSGHGWGCAYGTGQNCGKSPSKNAS